MTTCEVLIVGAGVAGASVAWHLDRAGVRDIVVIEAGSAGVGRTSGCAADGVQLQHALRSGSAVMDGCGERDLFS